MFQEIYRSEFAVFEYDRTSNLILHTWFSSTRDMSWGQFRTILENYSKLLDKYNPKSVIINATDFAYIIIPEEQEWLDSNINQKGTEMGIHKFGFVMSKDQIAQISNEQVMQEEQGQKITTQYFNNLSEAIRWVNE